MRPIKTLTIRGMKSFEVWELIRRIARVAPAGTERTHFASILSANGIAPHAISEVIDELEAAVRLVRGESTPRQHGRTMDDDINPVRDAS